MIFACLGLAQIVLSSMHASAAGETDSTVGTLEKELNRSMEQLKSAGKAPLYFLAYRLYEGRWEKMSATNGALQDRTSGDPWRMLSVDLRVGSPKLDNTHFLRGENTDAPAIYDKSSDANSILPVFGAGVPLRQALWYKTDRAFREAQERYLDIVATGDVLAAEEDKSGDFSHQPKHFYSPELKEIAINRDEWEQRVRRLSALFKKHPTIQSSEVTFVSEPTTRYIVNSEGSKLIEQHFRYQLFVKGSTLADDGTNMWLWDSAECTDPSLLPDENVMARRIEKLAKNLDDLRVAPAAEPFVGPAILSGKAAAVFFHETFGHRIEAVHEKSEAEGKTFARKIGSEVMPSFITVIDDPTKSEAHGEHLNGHYTYDDEGVPAQAVTLAKKGVLTGYLMGRTLVEGFTSSNGHGRSSPGWNPMARQSNLFVMADQKKQLSPQSLRSLLIKEAKKQKKQFGLYFEEIGGGATYTASGSEQTYSIYPLLVYKVFVDGRPDQLIKGADIVGTPLLALERIIAASTEYGVFNGTCGRESGPVPVSAVSPALLVQSIEIKRTAKTFDKPPILPEPEPSKKAALSPSVRGAD